MGDADARAIGCNQRAGCIVVRRPLPQAHRLIEPDREQMMKTRIAVMVLALAAMLPAYAGSKDIQNLATYTGMSVRKVQMIVGTRTAFAEYPYTYQRYKARFVKTLGEENYQQLMSGQPVKLGNGVVVQLRAEDRVAAAD
jgi:hypothetical protein